MEEDIKILEDMRDNIYGAMQFEDDYQIIEHEEKQFNALNLAINNLKNINKELDKKDKCIMKLKNLNRRLMKGREFRK